MDWNRKLWFALTSMFRLHIGINNTVAITVLAILIYQYVLKDLGVLASVVSGFDSESFLHVLVAGLISTLLGTVLLGALGVFVWKWYWKSSLTGDYDAFELSGASEIPWGTARIRFSPFSTTTPHTAVKVQLRHEGILMDGNGLVIDNRYLIGHYTDGGKYARRRSGSFMFEKDGEGDQWSGKFLYVDPSVDEPHVGEARWQKKKE